MRDWYPNPLGINSKWLPRAGSSPVSITIRVEKIYTRRKPAVVGSNTPNNNELWIIAVKHGERGYKVKKVPYRG